MEIETIPVTAECPPLSRASLPGLRVVHARFPSSLVMPRHLHESTCITVMLEGAFTESIGGRDYLCRRGTVLSKPFGEPHRDEFAVTGSRQIILELPDPEESRLSPYRHRMEEIVHLADAGALAAGQRLATELRHPDDVSPLAIEALALELLSRVLRRQGHRGATGGPRWLQRARELVHDRFAEPLTMQELASAVSIHPGHLARAWRRQFGCSIGDYLRRLRLEHAAELLRSTELPIAEIGLRCGFYDQSHLTRLFRQYRGCTPQAYRAAYR